MKKTKKSKKIAKNDYQFFVDEVVTLVNDHRMEAVVSVQSIANQMYWKIGELILQRQAEFGWGKSVIEQLSKDLNHRLGEGVSWSPRNLRFMRQLVEEYSNVVSPVSHLKEAQSGDNESITPKNKGLEGSNLTPSVSHLKGDNKAVETEETEARSLRLEASDLTPSVSHLKNSKHPDSKAIRRQKVGLESLKVTSAVSHLEALKDLVMEVPWGHNILILQKVKDIAARIFYLQATAKNKYTRAVLLHQINALAFENYVRHPSQHNFAKALPQHMQEQTEESFKSVYTLDFLDANKPFSERELERTMVERVKRFMMELGYGFCFIGNQYRITLGEKEYFIDLLFYHRILKCLVAVDLKIVEFEPEFVGKLDFYLHLVDEQLKQPDDRPSIGILLVPNKDQLEVEYALRTASKPIGVAQYKLSKELPEELLGKLPTAEDFSQIMGS